MIEILFPLFLSLSGAASLQLTSPVPQDWSVCRTAGLPDSDADGLSDACELHVAQRYAPVLVVREGGCNWEASAFRVGGGYLHSVQPTDSVIRSAYLPAYYRDCGWSGLKCILPWIDCGPHNGDSELIIVELRPRGADFEVSGVFLSAHCFGRSTASCRWYRGSELDQFSWQGSAPVVWVAEGRNANYPSREACDAGHHSIDTCDRHSPRYRFPVEPQRNLGSRRVPLSEDGCLTAAELDVPVGLPDAEECFWTDVPFRGWQGEGKGVTSYNRYLSEVARF
jgi:hypothetical protein